MTYERTSFQKLTSPPAFRVRLAERDELLDEIRTAAERHVILVDAPAGYGKTWLLGRHYAELRGLGTRVVWLGAGEMDANEFLALIVAGLERAGIDAGRLAGLAAEGFADVPIRAIVSALTATLESVAAPVVVFVDDLHRLTRQAMQDVLARLMDESPTHVRFVCSGRDCGLLPRAELRARGELLEIGADRLGFTFDEARQLLPAIDTKQIEYLLERTEGWPVALQLARLWLEAKPERSALLHAFSGRTSEVAEYLTEQVLNDLAPEVRQTLEQVAILDTLNPELVGSVTGRLDAWRLLLEDGRLEHFLIPLDEERYWFRLHHLLLDFLRARQIERGTDVRSLHTRAARWFEQDGDLLAAVGHAVLAGDLPHAVQLIERTGGWELVLFGGAVRMRALLGKLPADRIAEFPRVRIYQAFLAAKDGDLARGLRLYETTVAATSGPRDAALARDIVVVGHLLGRYADRPVAATDLEALYREVDSLPNADDAARAALLNTACLVALGTGDMTATLAACRRAVRQMRRIGSVLGLNYCLIHLGLAQLHLGERREAEATWREAAAMAEENFGADSGLKAIADVHLALALHARGEVAAAADRLSASLRQVECADGWLDLYAEGYEVAVANALARRSPGEAAAITLRMARTASERGLARLERLVVAFQARLVLASPATPARSEAALTLPGGPNEWHAGRWRTTPSRWREHHAFGLLLVLEALAHEEPDRALEVLTDLEAAAHSGQRRRQLRVLTALRSAARLQLRSEPVDDVITDFIASFEAAVTEDDTQYLIDTGPPLLPLLQTAWTWSRDNWPSSRGRHALAHAVTTLARASDAQDAPSVLSVRELEVLVELASGAPNKVIARNLHMTENTVKFHLKNVFQKLRVRHRAEALQAARARGLLS